MTTTTWKRHSIITLNNRGKYYSTYTILTSLSFLDLCSINSTFITENVLLMYPFSRISSDKHTFYSFSPLPFTALASSNIPLLVNQLFFRISPLIFIKSLFCNKFNVYPAVYLKQNIIKLTKYQLKRKRKEKIANPYFHVILYVSNISE